MAVVEEETAAVGAAVAGRLEQRVGVRVDLVVAVAVGSPRDTGAGRTVAVVVLAVDWATVGSRGAELGCLRQDEAKHMQSDTPPGQKAA